MSSLFWYIPKQEWWEIRRSSRSRPNGWVLVLVQLLSCLCELGEVRSPLWVCLLFYKIRGLDKQTLRTLPALESVVTPPSSILAWLQTISESTGKAIQKVKRYHEFKDNEVWHKVIWDTFSYRAPLQKIGDDILKKEVFYTGQSQEWAQFSWVISQPH